MYILLLALLLGLFGCQSSNDSLHHVRLVLDRPANPNHIPLYVGHALGYFREEGLSLEIQKPTTDKPLLQLDTQTADLVLASLPRVFRAIARKHNVYIVGKIIDKPTKGFLILQSSGMKSIEDFNGHTMGYDGAYSILPSAEVILDLQNVQVGCRLNLLDQAVQELVSKKVDIVYGALSNIEPEYVQFLGHKVRFFNVCELGMPEYEEVVVAAHSKFKSDKKSTQGFQKALQRSIDFCRDNPQLAFEMYTNLLQHNKSHRTLQWEETSWKKTLPLLAQSQQFSRDAVQTLVNWQYDNSLVGTQIPIDHHFASNLSK
ncbi:MAG: ABC transporter substrate-binding protein [Verrucomicrobia bacterium]|nr:ABC transporter substrate-binding protein [Verrucomicrobiota bacterium]MBS0636357.1 ABC transporter substrate-binding protein [Verrucomicrobiota bacterium]